MVLCQARKFITRFRQKTIFEWMREETGSQADIREQGKKDMDGGDHISVTEAPQNLATIAILVNFPSKTSNFTSRQREGLGIVYP